MSLPLLSASFRVSTSHFGGKKTIKSSSKRVTSDRSGLFGFLLAVAIISSLVGAIIASIASPDFALWLGRILPQ